MKYLLLFVSLLVFGCVNSQEVIDELEKIGGVVMAVTPTLLKELPPVIDEIKEAPTDPRPWIAGGVTVAGALAITLEEIIRRKMNKQVGNG